MRMASLTADAHVHSEWSWDAGSDAASAGAMRRICDRATRIGLPAVMFTEHLDFEDAWRVDGGDIGEHAQKYVDDTGYVRLPTFDIDGYLDAVGRCRHDYPELRILTGVEFGQPHLWEERGERPPLPRRHRSHQRLLAHAPVRPRRPNRANDTVPVPAR